MAASVVNRSREYPDIQIAAQSEISNRMAHTDKSGYDSMIFRQSN